MASKLDAPSHRSRWLMELTYGTASTLLITDWEAAVSFGGLGSFVSVPSLEIYPGELNGVMEESPHAFSVPASAHALFAAASMCLALVASPQLVDLFWWLRR